MLDWLGSEGDAIRIAFTKVFSSRVRPFGSQALQIGGLSDGRKGVQWNVAYDPRDGRQWVGVNLDGMQYDDWPIARLIERDLKEPSLIRLVEKDEGLAPVFLLLRRDYWQASARPLIRERDISPTPIRLGDLTTGGWRSALEEALDCLDSRRKRRGRAVQKVTLSSGQSVEGEVSPHLTFRYYSPQRTEWELLFREGREIMEPLHDWAARRARQPVRF